MRANVDRHVGELLAHRQHQARSLHQSECTVATSQLFATSDEGGREARKTDGGETVSDVHLGLLWVTPSEQDAAEDSAKPTMPVFKGTYGVQAFVASLSVSGRFGK